MKAKPINLTEKRMAALKMVADAGGSVMVGHIADTVIPRPSGHPYTTQRATQMGMGFVAPMIRARLFEFKRERVGCGSVRITDAGREALKSATENQPERGL